MRYRRLGRTELMVSEAGLEVRAALAAGEEQAEATLRAAMEAGITVFAWDVSDAAVDVEPLLLRVAGYERGRLTLVAVLDHLPAPEDIGPQVEAIADRLEGSEGEGYLDVIALPGVPDADQWRALAEVRERGVARFVGFAADSDAALGRSLPEGLDVLVLGGAPASDHGDAGVIARVAFEEAPALLEGRAVACVMVPAASEAEVRRLATLG